MQNLIFHLFLSRSLDRSIRNANSEELVFLKEKVIGMLCYENMKNDESYCAISSALIFVSCLFPFFYCVLLLTEPTSHPQELAIPLFSFIILICAVSPSVFTLYVKGYFYGLATLVVLSGLCISASLSTGILVILHDAFFSKKIALFLLSLSLTFNFLSLYFLNLKGSVYFTLETLHNRIVRKQLKVQGRN